MTKVGLFPRGAPPRARTLEGKLGRIRYVTSDLPLEACAVRADAAPSPPATDSHVSRVRVQSRNSSRGKRALPPFPTQKRERASKLPHRPARRQPIKPADAMARELERVASRGGGGGGGCRAVRQQRQESEGVACSIPRRASAENCVAGSWEDPRAASSSASAAARALSAKERLALSL